MSNFEGSGSEKPLVSIIVPIYNGEKYMRRCLDSLVNQTLENIEIITVDDGSSDGSLAILEEYKERFPKKIIILSIPHVSGAGAPRNAGLEIARGDYIGFCDSDDIMNNRAAELLYQKAVEGDYDLVCAPAWHVTGSSKVLYGVLQEPISTEMMILNGQVYLWNKLVHKRLVSQAGKMPEKICGEDLGYSLVLHSYARTIGYIDYPIYFYIKRFGSDSNTVLEMRNLDTIQTREYAIENCNPEYLQYVLAYVARHINSDLRKRWMFTDRYIQQLKKLWPELKDLKELTSNEYLYRRLERFAGLPEKPMPRNVFVGSFGEELPEKFILQIEQKAFYDGCNLMILNEHSCDISERKILKEAYDAGKFEFLNGYFALKAISQLGGIYLDKRIVIDTTFNYIRYCKAFFSLLDEQNYSDWVFGGMPEDPTIKKILKTYDDPNHDGSFGPLSLRIKDVLEEYKIPLNQVNNLFDYPVTVFSPGVMVCDTTDSDSLMPEPHICSHDFADKVGDKEYMIIKKSTLRALINVPGANDELIEVKKENAMLRNKIANMEFT